MRLGPLNGQLWSKLLGSNRPLVAIYIDHEDNRLAAGCRLPRFRPGRGAERMQWTAGGDL